MLAPPRHPADPLAPLSSSSRQAVPLSRSSSTRTRQPLGNIQVPFTHPHAAAPPHTVRDPSPPLHHKRDRAPSSAMVDAAAPPPRQRISSSDKERMRAQQQQQQAEQQQQHQGAQGDQQQQQQKAAAAPPSRAKLTEQWGEPPQQIRRDSVWLQRGDLLGEGGFARVYLCTEPDGITYKALKVIDKQQLKSTKTKSKLFAEIKIHQAMQHPNIIAFEHCFEDDGNVYMQLELCSNGSLLDLLRHRRRFSEPEARFYLTQLVGACDYMHANSVIHRDLKLGNLMLDENGDLRVGDFGLAALVKFPGERKKTICGTPNYIAPEILFDQKAGHSFEVDIWSIGVILYTLLIGRPPFQTKDVKNIYRKIRDNAYTFPPSHSLSAEALSLISSILHPTPTSRPTLAEILAHPWLTTGPFPARLDPVASAEGGERMVREEEGWRYMTRREARANFERVKRRAGIVEVEMDHHQQMAAAPALVSQALPAVAEAFEGSAESDEEAAAAAAAARTKKPAATSSSAAAVGSPATMARTTRMVRPSEEREAKGRIEKEVRSATAPESPISELLRSARKPLMVSPSSRAPPPLRAGSAPSTAAASAAAAASALPPQQPAFARTGSTGGERVRTTSGSSGEREKENAGGARRGDEREREGRHKRGTAAALDPLQRQPSARTVPSSSSSSSSSGSSLYDTTRANFDLFLSLPSSASLSSAISSLASSHPGYDPLAPPEPPRVFLTSWVDYTHKYGTAYALTDGTAGVYFNDSTTMVLSPDKEHFDYITNRRGNLYVRKNYALSTLSSQPPPSSSSTSAAELDRKSYLLRYFEDYMAKTLRRDVEWAWEDTARTKNMDFLVKYYRMKNAIVFKLSNEVLQFNFYDHTKLILTSSGLTLTFISPSFTLTTYSLASLFRLAASLGHYSPTPPDPSSEEGKKLEEVRFLAEKVEYCREVLKQLGERRREKERVRAEAKVQAAREEALRA
ncbi:hypothetical protein JCM6882_007526 [Rhodosporidiobolus microsporus]